MTEQELQETNSFTMPSNPADRKKIRDLVFEMSGALQAIEDKRSFMKDVATAIQEEFEIPKKVTMKMARTVFKQNYREVEAEVDQFTTAFETLFAGTTADEPDLDEHEE